MSTDLDTGAAPDPAADPGNYTRAILNILDDFSQDKRWLRATQQATLNMLADFSDDRARLAEVQRALLNLLEDFDAENKKVAQTNREMADEIAERRRAEAELQRRNEELDEFAYAASHDLKEPLRGIHNYAQFLIEDYAERLDGPGRERLHALMRLAERLESLIDALLQFSRAGQVALTLTPTDFNAVLAEVLDSVAATLAERGVKARVRGPLPVIHCDRARIGWVFRNLIGNAIKYNDKNRKWVEIGWHAEAGAPVFHVRDNGIGIPAQHRRAIFRIFKRLHGQDQYGGGRGVGLALVKKIVERHGGRIWVESDPGVGSTFYFTLNAQVPPA